MGVNPNTNPINPHMPMEIRLSGAGTRARDQLGLICSNLPAVTRETPRQPRTSRKNLSMSPKLGRRAVPFTQAGGGREGCIQFMRVVCGWSGEMCVRVCVRVRDERLSPAPQTALFSCTSSSFSSHDCPQSQRASSSSSSVCAPDALQIPPLLGSARRGTARLGCRAGRLKRASALL